MQSDVQGHILRAVAASTGVRREVVLESCPGADERDFRRALKLLFAADAITGLSPYSLTAEGRRRLSGAGLTKGLPGRRFLSVTSSSRPPT